VLSIILPFTVAISFGLFAGNRVWDIHVRYRQSKWLLLLYPLPIVIGVALGWFTASKSPYPVYLVIAYAASVLIGIIFIKSPHTAPK
jgi:hypothetical protein